MVERASLQRDTLRGSRSRPTWRLRAISGTRGTAHDETAHHGGALALPAAELGPLDFAAGLRRRRSDREWLDPSAADKDRAGTRAVCQGSGDCRDAAARR